MDRYPAIGNADRVAVAALIRGRATKLRRLISSIARRKPLSLTHYVLPPGNEELRRHIARKSLDLGGNLAAAHIIVTHGCMEALNLCVRAVAKPGDSIALESPTYFGLLQILESMGLKALEIPTHPREGISLEALEFALDRSRIAAVIAMPMRRTRLISPSPTTTRNAW
jgi:DNA-binding transcriptional MocR family regulator